MRTRNYTREILIPLQRMEQRERKRAQLIYDAQMDARRQLTEHGLCWRCCQPINARQFVAWAPDTAIVTHTQCN